MADNITTTQADGNMASRQNLYKAVTDGGYNVGTFDQFSNSLNNPDAARQLYDAIESDPEVNYDLSAGYDAFARSMGVQQAQPQNAAAPTAVEPQTETVENDTAPQQQAAADNGYTVSIGERQRTKNGAVATTELNEKELQDLNKPSARPVGSGYVVDAKGKVSNPGVERHAAFVAKSGVKPLLKSEQYDKILGKRPSTPSETPNAELYFNSVADARDLTDEQLKEQHANLAVQYAAAPEAQKDTIAMRAMGIEGELAARGAGGHAQTKREWQLSEAMQDEGLKNAYDKWRSGEYTGSGMDDIANEFYAVLRNRNAKADADNAALDKGMQLGGVNAQIAKGYMQRANELTANDYDAVMQTAVDNLRADKEKSKRLDGYIMALSQKNGMTFEDAQNYVYSKVAERILGEQKARQMGELDKAGTFGFVVSGLGDSVLGSIMEGTSRTMAETQGLTKAADKRIGNISDAENAAIQQYAGTKAGFLANFARGAMPMLLDMPMFISPVGKGASAIVGAGVKVAAGKAVKGAADAAARNFYKGVFGRYVGLSLPGKVVLGATQGALTGAMFGATSTLAQQYRLGDYDMVDVFTSMPKEALSWGVMGAGGVITGNLAATAKSAVARNAAKAAGVGIDGTVMAAPDMWEKYKEKGVLTAPDVASALGNGLATAVMFKVTPWAKEALERRRLAAKGLAPINMTFTETDHGNLSQYELLHNLSKGLETDAGIWAEPTSRAVAADGTAAEQAVKKTRLYDEYQRMMNDKEVPYETKAKVNYMMNGQAMAEPTVIAVNTRYNNDGTIDVYARTADGGRLQGVTAKTEAEAKKAVDGIVDVAVPNLVAVCETINNTRISNDAVRRGIASYVADNGHMDVATAERIYSAISGKLNRGEALTDAEKRFSVVLRPYISAEQRAQERFIGNTELAKQAARRAGIKESEIPDIADKPYSRMTDKEKAFTDEYIRLQFERNGIGGKAEAQTRTEGLVEGVQPQEALPTAEDAVPQPMLPDAGNAPQGGTSVTEDVVGEATPETEPSGSTAMSGAERSRVFDNLTGEDAEGGVPLNPGEAEQAIAAYEADPARWESELSEHPNADEWSSSAVAVASLVREMRSAGQAVAEPNQIVDGNKMAAANADAAVAENTATDATNEENVPTDTTEAETTPTTEAGAAPMLTAGAQPNEQAVAKTETALPTAAGTQAEPQPIGRGAFGDIYDNFKGKAKEAINFLKKLGSGEAVGALNHKEIGDISLVWGNEKAGLKKILHKHPDVADNLQSLLNDMHVTQSSDNRIVLESDTHKAVVSKMLGKEKTPQWLLTAYEKKEKASGGSSDIVPEPGKGKQNGTAPLQDTSSAGKDTTPAAEKQEAEAEKIEAGVPDIVYDTPEAKEKATIRSLLTVTDIYRKNSQEGEKAFSSLLDEFDHEQLRVAGEIAVNTIVAVETRKTAKDDWHRRLAEWLFSQLEDRGVVAKGGSGVAVGDRVCDIKRGWFTVVAVNDNVLTVTDDDEKHSKMNERRVKYRVHATEGMPREQSTEDAKQAEKIAAEAEHGAERTDAQGNPLNADGTQNEESKDNEAAMHEENADGLEGFLAPLTPMQKGRVKKVLSKRDYYGGHKMTEAEYIEQSVRDGKSIGTYFFGKNFEYGIIHGQSYTPISVTAARYAEFLGATFDEQTKRIAEKRKLLADLRKEYVAISDARARKGLLEASEPGEIFDLDSESIKRKTDWLKRAARYDAKAARQAEILEQYLNLREQREAEKPLPDAGKIGDFGEKRHKAGGGSNAPTEAEAALRDAVVDRLREGGLDVITDEAEGQRVLDEVNGNAKLSAKKRRALETASLGETPRSLTVVSSADGAKVLKNIDTLTEEFENSATQPKTFLGEIAKALGAERHGSASEYATFETKNDKVVTIRLSNHNAKVSNFDNRDESEGISIVVSAKNNNGINNDGSAHIVEYYYNAIKLRRAEGKPLAEIVRSIKQALYSGEFTDTTGLAERQEVNADDVARHHVRFFRTENGEAYGFTEGGKIYVDPRIAKADTPLHEYAHLWAAALRKNNPKEWRNVVELMRGTGLWDEVKKRYPELDNDDDIADEVLAHYSGSRGAERLRAEQQRIIDGDATVLETAAALSALERVKDALRRFWKGVADFLHIHFTTAEEVADRVLHDMLNGVDPRKYGKHAPDDAVRYRKRIFGGNSGYVGYSMSKRAARAREDGRFPKSDFKRHYGMTDSHFKALADAGILNDSEWHHTSMYGNETTFYRWEEPEYEDVYSEHKDEIGKIVKDKNARLRKLKAELGYSKEMENGQNPYEDNADKIEEQTAWERKRLDIQSQYYAAAKSIVKECSDAVVGVFEKYAEDVRIRQAENARREQAYDDYREAEYKEAESELYPFTASNGVIIERDGRVHHPKFERVFGKLERAAYEELGTAKLGIHAEVDKTILSPEEFFANAEKGRDADGNVALLRKNGNHTSKELEAVNERFNSELTRYKNGNMDKNEMLHLGRPQGVMRQFLPDLPIVMRQHILKKGSVKKHNVDVAALANMPQHLASPIFVFKRSDNALGVLTEMQDRDGKNVCVAIELNRKIQDGGEILEVNDIRSVHGRNVADIVFPIVQNGTLKWADKEKGLAYLSSASRYVQQEIDKQNLNDATKVIENFENPKSPQMRTLEARQAADGFAALPKSERKAAVEREVEAVDAELGTRTVVKDTAELDDDMRRTVERDGGCAYYDPATGETVVLADKALDAADVRASVVHENIGHKSVDELLGDKAGDFYREAAEHIAAPEELDALRKDYPGADGARLGSEWMAHLSETEAWKKRPTLWRRFVSWLRMFMWRHFGTPLSRADADYVLWKAARHAAKSDRGPLYVAEDAVRNGERTDAQRVKFRTGRSVMNASKVNAAAVYERRMRNAAVQTNEAFVDSMASLREAMLSVYRAKHGSKDIHIEDIPSEMNPYTAENLLSSRNHAQQEEFENAKFAPMLDEAVRLAPNKDARQDLTEYMFAKHGLERNALMRQREFDELSKKLDDANMAGDLKLAEKIDKQIGKLRDKDYAGLTGLSGTKNARDAEDWAHDLVDSYESMHDTAYFWDAWKDCTDEILKRQYESGLISKESYETMRDMYDNYVPLRGFRDETASDVWAYLMQSHGLGDFNPIKRAEGRVTVADDPFATLAQMADTSIASANRNDMKKRLLNFVMKNPSDLFTVRNFWIAENPLGEWEVQTPTLSPDMTAEEIDRAWTEFEERMQQLHEQDPDKYKRGTDAVNIPYIITNREGREHNVILKTGGRSKVITINGNPRAAQAINGLTNPDAETNAALKAAASVNRYLSVAYTTANPDFVLSNLARDTGFSFAMTAVKESPSYLAKYGKNWFRAFPFLYGMLTHNAGGGNSRLNGVNMQQMFNEFLRNGGETGYTKMNTIEQRKTEIGRTLSRKSRRGVATVKNAPVALKDFYINANRAMELASRFAAYLTSREVGRDETRAAYDAKEISGNFNKKGSGFKTLGLNGQTALGNVAAAMSGTGRMLYVFFNPAIQGTFNNFFKYGFHRGKGNAAKMIGLLGSIFAWGFVQALLNSADDKDDGNGYYDLPDAVRRDNLIFKTGDGKWAKIPLCPEFRSVFGSGELAYSVMSGKQHMTDEELAYKMFGSGTQILPIDPMESGAMSFAPFEPSTIRPMVEAYVTNTNFAGIPIANTTDYNATDPEWKRVYKSADEHIVSISKWLNEISGGDDFTKGAVNFNPEKAEYLITNYTGGVGSTVLNVVKSGEMIFGDREFDANNVPILRRFYASSNERTRNRAVNADYAKYKKQMKETEARVDGYRAKARNNVMAYAGLLNELNGSADYEKAYTMKYYDNLIQKIRRKVRMFDEETEADKIKPYEDMVADLKRQAVRDIQDIEDERRHGKPSVVSVKRLSDGRLAAIQKSIGDNLNDTYNQARGLYKKWETTQSEKDKAAAKDFINKHMKEILLSREMRKALKAEEELPKDELRAAQEQVVTKLWRYQYARP